MTVCVFMSKQVRPPCTEKEQQLIRDHEYLIPNLAAMLFKKFYWIDWEELKSYSRSGLVLAALQHDSQRQKSFTKYVIRAAFYLAVDEMRSDGVVIRGVATKKGPFARKTHWSSDILVVDTFCGTKHEVDTRGTNDLDKVDNVDFCCEIVRRLKPNEKRLVRMFIFDNLLQKQIADLEGVSPSAISLRYKAVIKKMRRIAEKISR